MYIDNYSMARWKITFDSRTKKPSTASLAHVFHSLLFLLSYTAISEEHPGHFAISQSTRRRYCKTTTKISCCTSKLLCNGHVVLLLMLFICLYAYIQYTYNNWCMYVSAYSKHACTVCELCFQCIIVFFIKNTRRYLKRRRLHLCRTTDMIKKDSIGRKVGHL